MEVDSSSKTRKSHLFSGIIGGNPLICKAFFAPAMTGDRPFNLAKKSAFWRELREKSTGSGDKSERRKGQCGEKKGKKSNHSHFCSITSIMIIHTGTTAVDRKKERGT